MNDTELKEVLERHQHWLHEDCDGWEGMRADLSNADLSYKDLRYADLRGAFLVGADLIGADLRNAELGYADMTGACLRGADLRGAIVYRDELDRAIPLVCNMEVSFIGWGKCRDNLIVKLQIPEDAKIVSSAGRQCRCSSAKVLAIENLDGTPASSDKAYSFHDESFEYSIGEVASVSNFNDDRREKCGEGIHFFITRKEAVAYG